MAKALLGDLAAVQTGYTFRAGVDHVASGSVRVIQMRDLGDDHVVRTDRLERIEMELGLSQFVSAGDILVRSRGESATSAIVAENPVPTVVAAPLLRVRVVGSEVSPSYLNWFINQPTTQAFLARNAEGSNVKMISKRALEQLAVEVPTAERQSAITELAELLSRADALESSVKHLRDKLVSNVMMRYAEGGPR